MEVEFADKIYRIQKRPVLNRFSTAQDPDAYRCAWFAEGLGHNTTRMDQLVEVFDDSPWPDNELDLLEVKDGTLVILHGQLPHYSAENTSNKSRQAFSIHLVDDNCHYAEDNWLQSEI